MHSKIEKIRAKLKEKLEERVNKKYAPAPRYDEEFYEGVAWLDSLGKDDDDGD
jgi:hypothetical protein